MLLEICVFMRVVSETGNWTSGANTKYQTLMLEFPQSRNPSINFNVTLENCPTKADKVWRQMESSFQVCQAGGFVATCSGLPQTASPSESNSHPPTFADIHLHPYVHLHPYDPMYDRRKFRSQTSDNMDR